MSSEKCSFCLKSKREVKCLIASIDNDVYMCNECVILANGIVMERERLLYKQTYDEREKLMFEIF